MRHLTAVKFIPVAVVFILSFIIQAEAGTTNQNVNISATVNANCKFSNPVSIDFGNYDPISTNLTAPLDTSGSVDISCTKGVTAALTIDQGQNYSSGRRFQGDVNTSSYLSYELYTSAARSTVWDSSVGGTVTYVSSTKTKTTETIYGRIPAGQTVDGSNYLYSDVVTVTATF